MSIFSKYERHKGYHWLQYVRGTKYKRHAAYVKRWVIEKNILDVGAGDGLITYLLRAKGIEYEPSAVAIAQAIGVDVIQGDAYNLPFEDDSFDAVTMIDVIEHLEKPQDALREAFRVAPVVYIATPPRGTVNDPFHVQEWLPEEFSKMVLEMGYSHNPIEVVPEHKSFYIRVCK